MANKNFPKKPGDVFFPFIALKYYGKVHKNLIIPDKKTATRDRLMNMISLKQGSNKSWTWKVFKTFLFQCHDLLN